MSFVIFLAVIAAIVLFAIGIYNSLVNLRNRVKNAFAQIDVQLTRRYDLIPNLVEAFALLGASLMTLVASFTKSFKEAQTWLSVVLLAPTLPILIVSILMVRPSTALMFIPSLSQHLLLVGLIKNEPVNLLHVFVSVGGTLAIGGLLTLFCARLYRREGLLG